MDTAYLVSAKEALDHFKVAESQGLSDFQAQESAAKYGRNGKQILLAGVKPRRH